MTAKLILLIMVLYLPQFTEVENGLTVAVHAYGLAPQATVFLDYLQGTVRSADTKVYRCSISCSCTEIGFHAFLKLPINLLDKSKVLMPFQ